jgi:hypothetical protein
VTEGNSEEIKNLVDLKFLVGMIITENLIFVCHNSFPSGDEGRNGV